MSHNHCHCKEGEEQRQLTVRAAGTDLSADCASFTLCTADPVQFIAAFDFSAIDFSRPSLECGEVKVRAGMVFCERAESLGPAVVNPSDSRGLKCFLNHGNCIQ